MWTNVAVAQVMEKEVIDQSDPLEATNGKKKKSKKKKPAAEAAAADDEALAEAAEAAAAEAAEAEDPEAAAENGDVLDEEGAADGDAAAKKKKKKKKKGKGTEGTEGANEDDKEGAEEEAREAPFAPPPRTEEDGEEEDGEEEQEGAVKKKKKRRGGGKKKTGTSGLDGIATHGVSDEDFAAWCQKSLEAMANNSQSMSEQELKRPPKEFWGYQFSGSLRPAFVTKQMRMPEGILLPDYALQPDGSSACERIGVKEVPILQGQELETMRMACKLGREVLDIAARFMRPGVTGDEIDRVVYQACVDRKIYPSPLNYFRFPKTVCVSANEVICHGIPDCRPIEEGDIVNLDVSIFYQGFHSDLNETFFIGDCDEDSQRLVRTAYSSLFAASQLIRPGTFYRDLGNAINAEAGKNNCAVVTTYCGHGVGQLFHGPPKVPHYRKNKAVGIMKPGHVFTVEPMINLGGNGGDRTWPDNWTAVTRDGKRSAQFEHTFLVTETGVEVLTARVGTDPTCMPPYNLAMFQR